MTKAKQIHYTEHEVKVVVTVRVSSNYEGEDISLIFAQGVARQAIHNAVKSTCRNGFVHDFEGDICIAYVNCEVQ